MTPAQFHAAICATRMPLSSRTALAASAVLVDHSSARQAAKRYGITTSAVTRAVKRLRGPQTHCETCGRPYPIHHTTKEQ